MIQRYQKYRLPSGRTVEARYLIEGTKTDWSFTYVDTGRQLSLCTRFVLAYAERI